MSSSRGQAAVPAFTALVVQQRLEQMPAAEIGPQSVGDPDLGVGDLPQQEIGDPESRRWSGSAGPDRAAGGVELLGEQFSVELVRVLVARRSDAAGIHDLRPAAVGQGDVEQQPGVLRRRSRARCNSSCARRRPDHRSGRSPEPDVVLASRCPVPCLTYSCSSPISVSPPPGAASSSPGRTRRASAPRGRAGRRSRPSRART